MPDEIPRPFVCPSCSRPIPNRRALTCGYCGAEIPEAARLSQDAVAVLDAQREAEQKRFEDHKRENPDKPSSMMDTVIMVDALIDED